MRRPSSGADGTATSSRICHQGVEYQSTGHFAPHSQVSFKHSPHVLLIRNMDQLQGTYRIFALVTLSPRKHGFGNLRRRHLLSCLVNRSGLYVGRMKDVLSIIRDGAPSMPSGLPTSLGGSDLSPVKILLLSNNDSQLPQVKVLLDQLAHL